MIDLHMHSRYSEDGEYTPTELVEQCLAKGIRIMSVTDHNCAKANIEAQAAAKENGIVYIPGIEIDCVFQDTNFHLLGYGIDFQNKDFELIEKDIKEQSLQTSLIRLAKTQEMGFYVTENDMWNISKGNYWSETWTGEMFAEILLAKPEYVEHPLLHPYRLGGSRSDNPYVNFYWDYYSQGKPCYVKTEYPAMEEMIDVIHRNSGLAVLAHPGVNLKGKIGMLDEIFKIGMDGIEAFSSYHSSVQRFDYYNYAKRYQLVVTCGSDFHGKTKPAISLGEHNCLVSEEEMETQLRHQGLF